MLSVSPSTCIDIHTHKTSSDEGYFRIQNLIIKPGQELLPSDQQFYSIGIHPWFLNADKLDTSMDQLRSVAEKPNILAIGECGIDLAIETSLEIQEYAFLEQAKIAENTGKPLIIHCVRAYHIIGKLLAKLKPKSPWIFHGFNQNAETVAQLLQKGAYFSIGSDIFAKNSRIRKSIGSIPLERVFLETDESDYSIEEIYNEASALIEFSPNELKEKVYRNYRKCFEHDNPPAGGWRGETYNF